MKHYIKTISWKFHDSTETYPQLKDKKLKVTSPQQLYDNFSFYLPGK
ncbi:MAG: hypothetical protein ACYCVH_11025 [Ignavibacteriaceae bacterium]